MFRTTLLVALLLSAMLVSPADAQLNLGRPPQVFEQISAHVGVVEEGDEFGFAVAVGDFDGDGIDDMAVAARREDIGSAVDDAGQVGVIYGSIAGACQGRLSQGFTQLLAGDLENDDEFGYALAAGDFNGDSYDDLAVGTPFEDVGSVVDAGLVQVFYGSSVGLAEASLETFDQIQAWAGAIETSDRFGEALAAGDFDDDGFDDLVIGAPYEEISGSGTDTGIFGVLYGSALGLNQGRASAWYSQGSYGGASSGYDHLGLVLEAGDFNGDGFDDVAAGLPHKDAGSAYNVGELHVIYGGGGGITTSGAQIFDQNTAGVGAVEAQDLFGASLAVGDFDGDGIDDLSVGSPYEHWPNDVDDVGGVSVLYGSPSKLNLGRAPTGLYQGAYAEQTRDDRFGHAVAAGDFDGDGYDDVAVTLIGADSNADPSVYDVGEVHVMYGSSAGVVSGTGVQQFDQEVLGLGSREAYDEFGSALATGDFDGDGVADLVATTPLEDLLERVDGGSICVLYGNDPLASHGTPIASLPMPLMLRQNTPNPFNPATTIAFDLPADGAVSLQVYDAVGRHVATLVDTVLGEGPHEIRWGGDDHRGQSVSSGVYAYVLESGGQRQIKRMTLVR